MKIVTVNPDKCTGCRSCELACSLKNTGEFNPVRARIQVIGFDELFSLPVTCFQCEKPFCARYVLQVQLQGKKQQMIRYQRRSVQAVRYVPWLVLLET